MCPQAPTVGTRRGREAVEKEAAGVRSQQQEDAQPAVVVLVDDSGLVKEHKKRSMADAPRSPGGTCWGTVGGWVFVGSLEQVK